MPSDVVDPRTAERAFVWTWLPGARGPVVAGVLERRRGGALGLTFAYGQSYLERDDALPLYLPELPLRRGRQEPPDRMTAPGVIRDAGPDAWGQRVVLRRLLQRDVRDVDPGRFDLLTYLLASGSDRAGNLDVQASPSEYVPRHHAASLADLQRAADDLLAGEPIPPGLDEALTAGSSVGGARPKATVVDGDRHLIAKFSAATDTYPVIRAEAVAMDLAGRFGLDVAPTELAEVAGRDVLLVERFDRGPAGTRRAFVSVLTILGLDEMFGRYATYHEFADIVRVRFPRRGTTLRELFGRIVANVLLGNTDDHARNHAAFWDGSDLALTPAYDICPQLRSGGEAAQAMEIAPGVRLATLANCLAAHGVYELSEREAREVINRQLAVLHDEWDDAADRARLTTVERDALWARPVANPYALDGYLARG